MSPASGGRPVGRARAEAHPSLALIKYWGKADAHRNLPATPSLGLTLDGMTTTTVVEAFEAPVGTASGPGDRVSVDGTVQPPERYAPFFSAIRDLIAASGGNPGVRFVAESASNFPSSAGMASSASGFAALAVASAAAAGLDADAAALSAVARVGSASAARSLWGGFVRLDAGAESARPVRGRDWWPELRTVVVQAASGPKPVPSRAAMESSRVTSPFYESWIDDAPRLLAEALDALDGKDLSVLGPLMRKSYLRMFSTMLSSDPPVLYWKPGSLAVLGLCEEMRSDGLSAWETMDAGPQVKVFCLAEELDDVLLRLQARVPDMPLRVCSPGGAPRVLP